jgi:hypothetical protein
VNENSGRQISTLPKPNERRNLLRGGKSRVKVLDRSQQPENFRKTLLPLFRFGPAHEGRQSDISQTCDRGNLAGTFKMLNHTLVPKAKTIMIRNHARAPWWCSCFEDQTD